MAKTDSGVTLPALVVRCPKRMRLRKTYSAHIGWSRKPPPFDDEIPQLTVRLVMPGAQVVPSERTLDPNRPNDKAVFYITPISKGWLRGERLEVLADGVKVQEIAMPTKVVGRLRTIIFLILTFLVPWFLITQIQGRYRNAFATGPDFEHTPWNELERFTGLENARGKAIGSGRRQKGVLTQYYGVDQETVEDVFNLLEQNYNVVFNILSEDGISEEFVRELSRKTGPDPKNRGNDDVPPKGDHVPKNEPDQPIKNDQKKIALRDISQPVGLKLGGQRKIEKVNIPMPEPIGGDGKNPAKQKKQKDSKNGKPKGKNNVNPPANKNDNQMIPNGGAAGGASRSSRSNQSEKTLYRLYLAYVSFGFFLFLTLVTWWLRRDKPKKRVGKPIKLSLS